MSVEDPRWKMGPEALFVDLSASSGEDEDDDLVCLTELPAHLLPRWSKKASPDVTPVVNDYVTILEDMDTIELICPDDIDKSSQKSSQSSCLVDDDCCILDDDPEKVAVPGTNCDDDSDELVMTGEIGHVACRDYPHPRHLCVKFSFTSALHKEFCPQCHCYVCDTPAPCQHWGDGMRAGDHCHASDKKGEDWKNLRQLAKSRPPGFSDVSVLPPVPPSSMPSDSRLYCGIQCSFHSPGLEPHVVRCKDRYDQVTERYAQAAFPAFDTVTRVSAVCVPPMFPPPFPHSAKRSLPTVMAGQSASYRGRPLGCPADDPARHQDPLEIPLSCPTNDAAHPRRHHSPHLGMHSKISKYSQKHSRRKQAMPFHLYQSSESEEPVRSMSRRRSLVIGVPTSHLFSSSSHSRSIETPGSIRAAHRTARAGHLAAPVAEESRWDLVSNIDSLIDTSFLRDFAPAVPDNEPEILLQQCPMTEGITNFSQQFETSLSQSEYEVSSNRQQAVRVTGSYNSILDVAPVGRGTPSLKPVGNPFPLAIPVSPPHLLDYQYDEIDIWGSFGFPGG